ncbi:MAG: hypothetical protein ABW061_27175, partial [Polyangiaceae bacterium]
MALEVPETLGAGTWTARSVTEPMAVAPDLLLAPSAGGAAGASAALADEGGRRSVTGGVDGGG